MGAKLLARDIKWTKTKDPKSGEVSEKVTAGFFHHLWDVEKGVQDHLNTHNDWPELEQRARSGSTAWSTTVSPTTLTTRALQRRAQAPADFCASIESSSASTRPRRRG